MKGLPLVDNASLGKEPYPPNDRNTGPSPRGLRFRTFDTVRYGDTDRQGHVNNAAFATFCETGRVNFLFLAGHPLAPPGTSFVIARVAIDFRAELTGRAPWTSAPA